MNHNDGSTLWDEPSVNPAKVLADSARGLAPPPPTTSEALKPAGAKFDYRKVSLESTEGYLAPSK